MFAGKQWKGLLSFGAGLALGLAALLGYVLGNRNSAPAPEFKLHAMSGYGTENFGMVTGPIDADAEGVFTLDYLTGELKCFVINPRTGKFGAGFKRNIVADLGVEKGKKGSFVLATGVVNFRGFTGAKRPANCVVYVADGNTGKFGAYMVPWTPGAFAAGVGQIGELLPLDAASARDVELRE